MNYGRINPNDIANGTGVRVTLFVSGCTHHCKGCFNSETWDFNYGTPFTKETEDEILELLKPDYIEGLTLLGGEPMEPENQREILPLLRELKSRYPDKTIWLYTGNLYEELIGEVGSHPKCIEVTRELLSYVDILVDGRFLEEQHRLGLRFRGSSNQRIIDMRRTLENGSIVLWHGMSEDKEYKTEKQK